MPTNKTMATYRVTLEYPQTGRPPTQATVEHLLSRLGAAAPAADPTVEVGIGRIHACLTVTAEGPEAAADQAVATTRQVFARAATRVDVQPRA